MRKLGYVSILFLILAVLCRLAYEMIGVEIDDQGFLYEPFALIPFGSLSFLIGIISGCVYVIMSFRRYK
jgi:hypothetical protein